MTSLFWPGYERADDLLSDVAFLDAMVRVEQTWLDGLVSCGLAPEAAAADLSGLVAVDDIDALAHRAEAGGNPAIPVVALLRDRVGAETAPWLHRGLTSQDVIDTALMLVLRDALDRLLDELHSQTIAASILAERHATTPMVGRTLTQHAVPTTFGAVVASWLDGIVDAAELLIDARALLPAQLGGAVGTLAAITELAALQGRPDPARFATELAVRTARNLRLRARRPWHTRRGSITRTADALVSCTDAWGHIATDVTTLSRTEIAEVAEPAADGRGGSSTMPYQHHPVLSVLIRRAALAAPGLASTLHVAAASAGDQRPDGAWHAEWETLSMLGRRSLVAASQTTELLQGLHVEAARMRTTLSASAESVLAERRAQDAVSGSAADPDPGTYLGTAELLVAGAVKRARTFLEETP